VEEAFSYGGLDWRKYVKNDPRYYRPSEVDILIGDPAKAKKFLSWEAKTRFKDLVPIMVDADIEALNRQATSRS
jgi:GDPmannose 4,6-dehydratase